MGIHADMQWCRHTRWWWHCIEFALTRPTYAASEHSMPPFPSSPTPPPPLSLPPTTPIEHCAEQTAHARPPLRNPARRRPPLAAPQLPPGAWCPLDLRRQGHDRAAGELRSVEAGAGGRRQRRAAGCRLLAEARRLRRAAPRRAASRRPGATGCREQE